MVPLWSGRTSGTRIRAREARSRGAHSRVIRTLPLSFGGSGASFETPSSRLQPPAFSASCEYDGSQALNFK